MKLLKVEIDIKFRHIHLKVNLGQLEGSTHFGKNLKCQLVELVDLHLRVVEAGTRPHKVGACKEPIYLNLAITSGLLNFFDQLIEAHVAPMA